MITKVSVNSVYKQNKIKTSKIPNLQKTDVSKRFVENNSYNPGFYPIVPAKISFGSVQSSVLEGFKAQKLGALDKISTGVANLFMLESEKGDKIAYLLKLLKKERTPENVHLCQTILPNVTDGYVAGINDGFEQILSIDSKIQQETGSKSIDFSAHKEFWDWRYPGFSNSKMTILNQFVKPILDERAGINASVPSGMVLYGPGDMNVMQFIYPITEMAGAPYKFINANEKDYIPKIESLLADAKQRYKEHKVRTIIVCPWLEQVADTSPENAYNVDYFKTRLDACSKTPDQHSEGCATTFIFTAKEPGLIHKDLRKGKIGDFISLSPTNNEYVEEFFKLKAVELNLDPLDYKKLVKITSPNPEKGAFSLYELNDIFDIILKLREEKRSWMSMQEALELGYSSINAREIDPETYKIIKRIEDDIEMPSRSQDEVDKIKRDIGIK